MKVKHVEVGSIMPFGTRKSVVRYKVDEVLTPSGNLKKGFSSVISDHVKQGYVIEILPVADFGSEYIRIWGNLPMEARRDITKAIKRGHRIDAIRTYRSYSGKALKPSVSFIGWLMEAGII
jgi:hypothetical protein